MLYKGESQKRDWDALLQIDQVTTNAVFSIIQEGQHNNPVSVAAATLLDKLFQDI